MIEGYLIARKLEANLIVVIGSRHFKRDITKEWKQAKKENPDAKMILLKCTLLDSFNVIEH